jgi:hypothetical protein
LLKEQYFSFDHFTDEPLCHYDYRVGFQ